MSENARIYDNDDAKARAWANVYQENKSVIKQILEPEVEQDDNIAVAADVEV